MDPRHEFPPVHLRDHLRVLKKRKWTGLAFFAVLTVATALYLVVSSPSYQAKVIMTIKPPSVSPLMLSGELSYMEAVDVVTRKLYTQTQFEVLKSRKLAERVMDRLNLWQTFHVGETTRRMTDLWKKSAITRETALDAFTDNVDVVSPTALSFHIEVRYKHRDPEQAARIANALVDAYTDLLYEERSQAISKNLAWLKDEFEKLDAEVVSAEEEMQQFKKQKNAVSVDDRQNILLEKLRALNASLTQARIARIAAENAYTDAQRLRKDPTALETAPFVVTSNPQIAALNTQYNTLKTQISGLKTRYKEKHPQMVTLTTTLAQVKESIRSEVEKALDALKANYEYTKRQEESLQRELETTQAQVIALDKERITYVSLLDKAKVNRAIYDTLLTRLKETNIIQEFHNPLQNITIIDRAVPPDAPAGYRNWYLPVAALVGLLVGTFLCYVKDYFDASIQNERDVYECMKVPVLAALPSVGPPAAGDGPFVNVSAGEPVAALFKEQCDRIAEILVRSTVERPIKTLLVTSVGPREGKTTVVANLAVVLARRGARILLVDADLRKPSLHTVFDVPNDTGLSDCAATPAPGATAGLVKKTGVENVFLLPSGTRRTDPATTLHKEALRSALEALKGSFDMVLLDSSCVQEVPDAGVLATWADATLWVVRSGQTLKENAVWAARFMEDVKAAPRGAVLNGVRFFRGATHYYFARGAESTTGAKTRPL